MSFYDFSVKCFADVYWGGISYANWILLLQSLGYKMVHQFIWKQFVHLQQIKRTSSLNCGCMHTFSSKFSFCDSYIICLSIGLHEQIQNTYSHNILMCEMTAFFYIMWVNEYSLHVGKFK